MNGSIVLPDGARGLTRAAPGLARTLRILAKHGFLGVIRGREHWPTPVHVRAAFEELGVVYLKFGQVLAMRRDFLPDAYIEELERLHDRLPPLEFERVRAVIEQQLGDALDRLFPRFDPQPLAAATIAQVHAASLADGRPVVVKVRRPDLETRIAHDMATLTYLAAAAERSSAALRQFDLVGMVREFRESLRRETDFRLEAQNIRRFRGALLDASEVWIPDVIGERSTEAVLTLEHSPGERIDRYAEQHPAERPSLARGIAALVLRQVFETGLFHADPHPGNVFVLPDGRLCLHDFGNIGELDDDMRERLTDLLDAAVRGDARAAADAYLELGLVGQDIDRAGLEADIGALLRRLRERPVTELSVGDALQSLVRVGSAHTVRNPGVLLQLARAFFIAEAIMRELDPSLSVFEAFKAEVSQVALRRFAPERLARQGREVARQLERMIREGPGDARRALRRLADGDLGRVGSPGVEALGRRASRDLERLTGAVAAAALVIGGGLLATAGGWHRTAGDILLAIGVIGTFSVAISAWFRSKR